MRLESTFSTGCGCFIVPQSGMTERVKLYIALPVWWVGLSLARGVMHWTVFTSACTFRDRVLCVWDGDGLWRYIIGAWASFQVGYFFQWVTQYLDPVVFRFHSLHADVVSLVVVWELLTLTRLPRELHQTISNWSALCILLQSWHCVPALNVLSPIVRTRAINLAQSVESVISDSLNENYIKLR